MWCTSAAVLPVAFRFGIGLFIISSFVRLLVVLSGRWCGRVVFLPFSFYSLSLHTIGIVAV